MSKRRTMTIGVYMARVSKGWGNAQVVLDDNRDDQQRRVIINVRDPNDLNYLREQLNAIEQDWKARIATLVGGGGF